VVPLRRLKQPDPSYSTRFGSLGRLVAPLGLQLVAVMFEPRLVPQQAHSGSTATPSDPTFAVASAALGAEYASGTVGHWAVVTLALAVAFWTETGGARNGAGAGTSGAGLTENAIGAVRHGAVVGFSGSAALQASFHCRHGGTGLNLYAAIWTEAPGVSQGFAAGRTKHSELPELCQMRSEHRLP
jgi:hypothetical protein